jgi:membrane-bound metal-dependent hydrolase YbcI (DUF457 family)
MYQKQFYYSDIKIYNKLPKVIKDFSSEPKRFKIALKHYQLTHSFYSLDEFFLATSNILLLLCLFPVFLHCKIRLYFLC